MDQSNMKPLTCGKCKLEFKYKLPLAHYKSWTAEDQLLFHQKHECAVFDFSKAINYAYFRPIKDDHVFQPISCLTNEVGNLTFVYTGKASKNHYLIRAISQLFILYDAYHKKGNKTLEDDHYTKIYEQTVINSEIGLCLMIVRSSYNLKEVETSEFNMIHAFRSHANPLFYNLSDGQNSLNYNMNQSKEMRRSNYRRIQYKLKKGNEFYLKFTDGDINNLRKKAGVSEGILKEGLVTNILNKERLEGILEFLFEKNKNFFKKNQEPDENSLVDESFFERKEDGGSILKRVFSYCNNNWKKDDEIGQRLAAYKK